MIDPSEDPEENARKQAEDAQKATAAATAPVKPPPATSSQAPQPAPQAKQTATTNTGSAANVGTPQAPTVQTAPQPQAQQRAAPTNYTNFARRFAANKDVAQREAQKYGQQATDAAQKAAASLGAAQKDFATQEQAGMVPEASAPAADLGPYVPPPGEDPEISAIKSQEREKQRAAAAAGQPTIADMLAKAGQSYSGPAGLDTSTAATDANAAAENLDALKDSSGVQALVNQGQSGSTGADALSGSLIGAAGRHNFDALRGRFNPNKDLLDAQKTAAEQAKKAKDDSATNADAWGQQAADAQAKQDAAADKSATDSANAKTAADAARTKALNRPPPPGQEMNIMAGLENDPEAQKQRGAEYAQFQEATKTDAGDTVRDLVNASSPSQNVAEATGNRNPLGDYFTSSYHQGHGNASGSTHGDHIPWGESTSNPQQAFFVWRQMDARQWDELNRLPHDDQKKWIANRWGQIRGANPGQLYGRG